MPALVVGLALASAGCAASKQGVAGKPLVRQQPVSLSLKAGRGHRGPFVPNGALYAGNTSGYWGDVSRPGGGETLGCLSGRRYAFAITVRNRSGSAVVLTGVRGPDPLPRVVDRVAEQVRLAPSTPTGDVPAQSPLRAWSAAPAAGVTIQPGQSAVVQSNFLMRHCSALTHRHEVRVPGSFLLSYSQSGRAGEQHVAQRSAAFRLVAGPVIRGCRRATGFVSLTAADISCTLARRAAYACRYPSNPNLTGECAGGGHQWHCNPRSWTTQQCSFADRTSHWYRVRWAKP